MTSVHDRPLAAEGLTSYRYRGRYGWVMIGATSVADALNEARRSTQVPEHKPERHLQVWNGQEYVPVK